MNLMDRLVKHQQKEDREAVRTDIAGTSAQWLRNASAALAQEASDLSRQVAVSSILDYSPQTLRSVDLHDINTRLSFTAAAISPAQLPNQFVVSDRPPTVAGEASEIWINTSTRETFVYSPGPPDTWISIQFLATRIFDLERAVQRLGGNLF